MLLSIIHVTNRGLYPLTGEEHRSLGQYDLLAQCLREQTWQDFEVIVVDEHNPLPRPELTWWLRDRVRCVRPRVTPWRKLGAFAAASARNTGLVHAHGEVVLTLDDCYSFEPQFLERIAELFERDLYVVPSLHPSQGLAYLPTGPSPVPADKYGGGMLVFPLEAALQVNGYDERFDGCDRYEDVDFFDRLRRRGVPFVYDPSVYVVGYAHGPRTTRTLRCAHVPWQLALERRATSLRANEPWTADELQRFESCGRNNPRSRRCLVAGGMCEYDEPELAEAAAIRRGHEAQGMFDLAVARGERR